MAKAVMKKDESRVFIIDSFDGETITMHEDGQEQKSIKKKTFVKAYKMIEGALGDMGAATQPAPPPPPPTEEPVATNDGYVQAVTFGKNPNQAWRIANIELLHPEAGIEHIDESVFITELIRDHGVVHGDKAFIGGKTLGFVDLTEDKRKFGMLNPPLLKGQEPPLIEDPLPEVMNQDSVSRETEVPAPPVSDSKPPLVWNVRSSALDMQKPLPPKEPVDLTSTENSMRANRAAKLDGAKPFVPEPYFLRQSMVSSYLQCPDKMYDTYENGYNEESIFTRVGTAIHGVMEDYYNLLKQGEQDAFDGDMVFDKWWAEHAVPEWDWYRDWKMMVAKYFAKEKDYEQPQVIATELEFRTTINGVPVSGTIDRVDRVDEQTIRIVDYKTNFMAFTDQQLNESLQFMMYTAAISTPEVRQLLRERGDNGEFNVVICTYEMVRLGFRQTVMFDKETMATFEQYMKTIWEMILSGTNRKPKLNQYCGYCQKRHRCSLYLEILGAPVSPILTEDTDMEVITGEREALTQRKKVIEGRLKEIEEQIKAKIAENKGSLVVGEYEYTTKSGTRNVYPAGDVFRILAMNGLGGMIADLAGNVSKSALDRHLKSNKDVMELIEQKKVETHISPSINKKKVKK